MPGLNLLAEYELDFSGMFLLGEGEDFVIDGVEHLLGVLESRRPEEKPINC
jgi:hypothetical protein